VNKNGKEEKDTCTTGYATDGTTTVWSAIVGSRTSTTWTTISIAAFGYTNSACPREEMKKSGIRKVR
jgi:hypothetical protein